MRNRKIPGVSGLAIPAPLHTTGRERPVKTLGFKEDGEGVWGLHIRYMSGVDIRLHQFLDVSLSYHGGGGEFITKRETNHEKIVNKTAPGSMKEPGAVV